MNGTKKPLRPQTNPTNTLLNETLIDPEVPYILVTTSTWKDHEDDEGKEKPGKTLRQNSTHLGVVFSPSTLFTWKSKQDKHIRQQITYLDSNIIKQAHSFTYNPYSIQYGYPEKVLCTQYPSN
jgi:hypothetical protein